MLALPLVLLLPHGLPASFESVCPRLHRASATRFLPTNLLRATRLVSLSSRVERRTSRCNPSASSAAGVCCVGKILLSKRRAFPIPMFIKRGVMHRPLLSDTKHEASIPHSVFCNLMQKTNLSQKHELVVHTKKVAHPTGAFCLAESYPPIDLEQRCARKACLNTPTIAAQSLV